MTFLNPWAWLGLIAVAVPIAAHLLSRRSAKRQVFPTLRFLPASVLRPVRRSRFTDLWLLALRCLVIVVAVAAVAQPAWRNETQTTRNQAAATAAGSETVATKPVPGSGLILLASTAGQAGAAAARTAARTIAGPGPILHPVTVVFPGHENRESLLRSSRPIDEPWMFDVLHAVVSDRTVRNAFQDTDIDPDTAIAASRIEREGNAALLLDAEVPPHSLASAAMIAAILRVTLPVDRPPVRAIAPVAAGSQPIGRYFWLAALALLGLEQWIRRARRS
jgi:hypothetical protein